MNDGQTVGQTHAFQAEVTELLPLTSDNHSET
jgi:hypothetical protein